ncbi:FAD-dependent oxidoreductase [Candidatus Dependentiae bacterium]|nr:FAD-dependent oxidoreductase [Candidatus Dependentiae bacterium]
MIQCLKKIVILLPIVCFVACLKDDREKNSLKNNYNLSEALVHENVVPVAIIGSGPAGLSAALYVSRAGMKSFVFAGPTPCGQLTQTTYIENWPGRERVLGATLMDDIKKQAQSFGAFIIHDTIVKVDAKHWPFSIETEEGKSFKALSIIVASGATPKTLGIPGESKYWGNGVTTCAICDAPFFKDGEVIITGGGDSAAEMIFELAPYVKKATVLVRKDRMRAAVAMQERIARCPNVSIEYNKELKEIFGNEEKITGVEVYDNRTKVSERRSIDGVFLAIGHIPNNGMVKDQVPMDDYGYIKMHGRSQESLVPGIFAAGEIQDPEYRQAIIAAGEGAKAGIDATSFLYSLGFNVEIGNKLDQRFYETFSDEKREIPEISQNEQLYDLVLNVKGLVLLDFYATTCPSCIKMIPILESIFHKFHNKLHIYKVNYNETRRTIFKELWRKHDIQVKKLPALLVFKDGKLLDLTYQIMNRKEMNKYLQKFL